MVPELTVFNQSSQAEDNVIFIGDAPPDNFLYSQASEEGEGEGPYTGGVVGGGVR